MRRWLTDNRGFVLFLLCFGFFRTAIADWNPIPSGSMRPTLLEGDVVLINRVAYDFKLPLTDIALVPHLAEPQRGDIVTFTSPTDDVRLIKRIVATPGDRVEMQQGRLLVNGQPAQYAELTEVTEWLEGPGGVDLATQAVRGTERSPGTPDHAVQFLPQRGAIRDFAAITLGADQFFMMGDNRDNSADSRYFGPVPRERLIGRAHHILASADIRGNWLPRFARFGQALN